MFILQSIHEVHSNIAFAHYPRQNKMNMHYSWPSHAHVLDLPLEYVGQTKWFCCNIDLIRGCVMLTSTKE